MLVFAQLFSNIIKYNHSHLSRFAIENNESSVNNDRMLRCYVITFRQKTI